MKFKYKSEGGDCPNCAAKLANKMADVDGIDSAAINFLSERLTIESEISESEWIDKINKVAKDFDKNIKITSK